MPTLPLARPAAGGELNRVASEIPPQWNLDFFSEKYRVCRREHGIRCEWFKFLPSPSPAEGSGQSPRAMSFAQDLRVIDVQKQNIVKAPFQRHFVALSYIWGKIDFLRLTRANRAELEQVICALDDRNGPLCSTVPASDISDCL